jgi:hypothetical protein
MIRLHKNNKKVCCNACLFGNLSPVIFGSSYRIPPLSNFLLKFFFSFPNSFSPPDATVVTPLELLFAANFISHKERICHLKEVSLVLDGRYVPQRT